MGKYLMCKVTDTPTGETYWLYGFPEHPLENSSREWPAPIQEIATVLSDAIKNSICPTIGDRPAHRLNGFKVTDKLTGFTGLVLTTVDLSGGQSLALVVPQGGLLADPARLINVQRLMIDPDQPIITLNDGSQG